MAAGVATDARPPAGPSLPPPVSARTGPAERERLVATLALSLIVHALVVLGLGFAREPHAPAAPTLDVILSRTMTPLTPKEADFMAQANQQGGGEHAQARRPRDSQLGTVPAPHPGLAQAAAQAPHPQPTPPPARQAAPAPGHTAPVEARVVASPRGDMRWPPPQARTEGQRDPAPRPGEAEAPRPPRDEARVRRDAEMARLAAEVHLRSELYAKRPTRKFISASTREYAYADYLRAWVDQAERVGNLNYPDEARQRRLGGQVVISVAIRRNGSVENSRVLVSSGVPLLDSSALRIVKLAEPFPPLPETSQDVDILHVTRTWVFMPDGRMRDD